MRMSFLQSYMLIQVSVVIDIPNMYNIRKKRGFLVEPQAFGYFSTRFPF